QRVITAVTIQTENKDLHFEDVGGLQRATMNIYGRVIAVSGKRSGIFEDSVVTTATPQELVDAKERKSAYQKAIPLSPGVYKVEVVVRDVKTGATGIRKIGFEVPKYDPKQLGASTLVLAAKLEKADPSRDTQMFTIRQTNVIPNISGNFHRGQPLGVYMQVY